MHAIAPHKPSLSLPFYAATALILLAFAVAITGRLTGAGREQPVGKAVAARSLSFADRQDGAVIVRLLPSNQILDVLTGQNGFLRGTLRGFARTRRADGVGAGPPLSLTGYQDGRLILTDPSTGRYVDLEAFGRDNEAVFSRLLTMPPVAQSTATGEK